MKSEGVGRRIGSGLPAINGDSSLDTLVIAAHELKSPLAVMRQLALELQMGHLDTKTARTVARQIQLLSERSLRHSSDLTKYKQLQTTLFATSPVHAREVWRDVATEISPLYAAMGKSLALRSSVRAPLVVANYDLLRRILLNFVDNALHYSDADGVVELYTKLVDRKQYVRLAVRDRGPALPQGVWRAIYSDAISMQPVHARPSSSGLGLRIACEFARSMNASVGATRHRDGATFYVDVPVSKQLSLL